VRGPVARTAVLTAAATVGTAWPLRNMVAANPLARLESMPFDDAVETAARAHSLAGTAPVCGRAPLHYYLDLFDSGRIKAEHVAAARKEAVETSTDAVAPLAGASSEPAGEASVAQLVSLTRSLVDQRTGTDQALDTGSVMRFCAALPPEVSPQVTALVDAHASLWAQRTWPTTGSAAPGPAVEDRRDPVGPWDRWRRAAARSGYDAATGIRGAADWARTLPTDPADAIEHLARRVELPADLLLGYLVATLASAPGWAAHASWRSRRSGDVAPLLQLAALRMAHDVLFSGAVGPGQPRPELRLSAAAPATAARSGPAVSTASTMAARIWQRALEIGVEEWLLASIMGSVPTSVAASDQPLGATPTDTRNQPPAISTAGRPVSQSLWCIDVRSERVRRHLEASGDHRTYGYAGFFGAAVRYLDADGVAHDQCPALIEPSFTARRRPTPLRFRQVLHRTVTAVSATPLGSLVVAEGGGILAALSSTSALLAPATARRFVRGWIGDDPRTDRDPLVTDLGVREKVDLAAAALRNTGLTENFAPLIVVCGHGSTTENNAFGTAYDCGACGGNEGRVNARLLVDALNDEHVRAHLAQQGLRLPADTVAVAALHDTSTDEITIARPGEHIGLETALAAAGRQAALERRPLLPVSGRSAPTTTRAVGSRAADWSEPTPEWGLAGNAAIVFGPRELTLGADLGSRVFLHGYDRHGDRDGRVLEQLLTAPLVVAQWINAQYYFSAVDPETFGAGDKTTHNVVGDVGVLTGAHGDLRTGLPWQSLFRQPPGTGPLSQSLAHEPVRLLAVVDADPDLVVDTVKRHVTLTQLVGNEWIRLVCLDAGRAIALRPDLTWRPRRARGEALSTPVTTRPDSPAEPRLSETPIPRS
ncbi:MAG: putative inorganic carbon transporter subunit DabA, partial [Terracoccus sp.]